MTQSLVIVGCGGFGREVWSIVDAINRMENTWTIEGFIDDAPSRESLDCVAGLGAEVVGSTSELARRHSRCSVVLAIGSPATRSALYDRIASKTIEFPPVIHPQATIGSNVRIDEGVVVAPGARISTNITVGRHVHVDQNVTVGHDTMIGDFSRLNPMACIGGSVSIGRGSLVGANATVLQGLSVGAGATVGAAACVTHSVADGATVKGVPAR